MTSKNKAAIAIANPLATMSFIDTFMLALPFQDLENAIRVIETKPRGATLRKYYARKV